MKNPDYQNIKDVAASLKWLEPHYALYEVERKEQLKEQREHEKNKLRIRKRDATLLGPMLDDLGIEYEKPLTDVSVTHSLSENEEISFTYYEGSIEIGWYKIEVYYKRTVQWFRHAFINGDYKDTNEFEAVDWIYVDLHEANPDSNKIALLKIIAFLKGHADGEIQFELQKKKEAEIEERDAKRLEVDPVYQFAESLRAIMARNPHILTEEEKNSIPF